MAGDRFFFVLLWSSLVASLLLLRNLLVPVMVGAVIAVLLDPVFRWLLRAFRGRRRPAALAASLGAVLVVLAPLGWLTVRALAEAAAQLGRLSSAGGDGVAGLLDGRWPAPLEPLRRRLPDAEPLLRQLAGYVATHLGAWLAALAGATSRFALGTFIVFLSAYYFFQEGRAWAQRTERLLPMRPAYTRAFFAEFRQVSRAMLIGNLGTALAQGVVGGASYALLGVRAPVLLGALTAVAALIPILGTPAIWLPVAAGLALTGRWGRAAVLVALGVAVIGTVDNVVRPMLSQRALALPPLVTFLAIFGGITVLGASGLLVGPLIGAITLTAVRIYERDFRGLPPPPRQAPA